MYLRQNTASQAVILGPFVDTDGAPVTGLTIDAADIRLSKNGANIVGKNSGGATHDELGMYAATFDATDTDTVGRLQIVIAESGALLVYHEFQVVEEAVFDALYAASAPGYGTAQTGDSYARLGAPAGASVSADIAAVKSDTAATLVDTNELQTDWVNGGRLDLILDSRAAQTTADAIETDTQDIQSRIPAALDNGFITASVKRVGTTTLTAAGTGGQGYGG